MGSFINQYKNVIGLFLVLAATYIWKTTKIKSMKKDNVFYYYKCWDKLMHWISLTAQMRKIWLATEASVAFLTLGHICTVKKLLCRTWAWEKNRNSTVDVCMDKWMKKWMCETEKWGGIVVRWIGQFRDFYSQLSYSGNGSEGSVLWGHWQLGRQWPSRWLIALLFC